MSDKNILDSNDMTRLFFKFAIPSIFGMLIVSIQVMIDGMFIGQNIGPIGLAAINLAMPLISFLLSIGLMICIGGSVITSIYYGNKQIPKARELAAITLILLFVVLESLSLIVLSNLDFFIGLLGANEQIFPYVKAYMIPMMLGAFFYSSPIFTETFIKIEEKPHFVFISGLICLTTNVLLDYLFIIKLNFGISGGAIATIMACAAGFFALLPNIHFQFPKKNIKYYFNDIKNIFYNGSSEMLSVISSTIATYLFNLVLMEKIGILGVSALTIVFYISQLLNISLYGVSQALQPLVSYNIGAKNLERIKKALKIALITGGSIGIIAYFGSFLSGNFIISIFSKGNKELILLAKTALFYISFSYLLSFINIISTSFLTSIEKPLESIIVSVGRSFVFIVIPLFILPNFIGSIGIWMAIPVAEFICLFVSFYFMKKSITNLNLKLS